MKNKSSSVLVEDTEEMIGWRAMSQLEVDECWTIVVGEIEEDVLNKYNVENITRTYRGRGAPLEWGLVRRRKKYRQGKWVEDCWARIFSWFGECNLQRLHSMHDDSTDGEEMRQRQRMKDMKDMTRKIRA